MICRPGGGSSIRTVMAIAERMPEVGRRFYENVLEKTINRLADYLQAHVEPDDLAIDDCRARRLAVHADVPGLAVPAVHLPGRAGAVGRAHRAKWSKARRGCFWRRIGRSRRVSRRLPDARGFASQSAHDRETEPCINQCLPYRRLAMRPVKSTLYCWLDRRSVMPLVTADRRSDIPSDGCRHVRSGATANKARPSNHCICNEYCRPAIIPAEVPSCVIR